MNPGRWVRLGACTLAVVIASAWFALPATAQFVEPIRPSYELPPNPIARSPRLLGMGRLTLVIPDDANGIQLWDFANNPAGLYDSDSTSVLELRPNTTSSSSTQNFSDEQGPGILQTEASRDARLAFDAWRRQKGETAYGLIGGVNLLRGDLPYNSDTEVRSQVSNPAGMPVITGPMPFVLSNRMVYALRGIFAITDTHDAYRFRVRNAAGSYLDHEGTLIGPPDFFTPDDYFVRQMGGGASVALRATPWLTWSLGGDITSQEIKGSNDGERYDSQTEESRPLYKGQTTFIGKIGKTAEWGLDAQAWSSSSSATWVFTISPSGGPGPSRPPLAGRGNLFKRQEDGNRLRARVRWPIGNVELGGSFGTLFSKTRVTPAPLADPSSFNLFRFGIYLTEATGDTLVLPEEILRSTREERGWEASGGASWRIPDRHSIVGFEYHYIQNTLDAVTSQGSVLDEIGGFPQIATASKGKAWDVRAGGEFGLTEVLMARLGYIYRWGDQNEDIQQNEFLTNTATLGLGLQPLGASWGFDAGFALAWGAADYGTPVEPHSKTDELSLRVRWNF
jgi:hypothetical protein